MDPAGALRQPRCGQAGRIRGVSRRTARQIASKAMDLVHKDLEATNVENPQMATVLIHNLQECMARGMESNNIGAAVAAARELNAMLGIGVHNRRPPNQYYRR